MLLFCDPKAKESQIEGVINLDGCEHAGRGQISLSVGPSTLHGHFISRTEKYLGNKLGADDNNDDGQTSTAPKIQESQILLYYA